MIKIAFISNGYESLGIEFLSFALKKRNFDVKMFIDPCLFNEAGFWNVKILSSVLNFRDNIINELKEYSPDIICFSVFTDTYQWAVKWADLIKREIPDVKVIFGGIHSTLVPYQVIQKEAVDCVVCGEGEEVIYYAVLNLMGYEEIVPEGVLIKKEKRIIGNPRPVLIKNIDDYYPDKSIFYSKFPFYSKFYLTLSSRGCPFSCSYCSNSFYHLFFKSPDYYRLRNTDNIIYELKTALSVYEYEAVHFTDEVFNIKKDRMNKLLLRYRNEISKPFSCYIYPDLIDEDTVKILKESGCVKVQFGIQTCSETKRREIYNRFSSNLKIANAIKLFKKYRIFTVVDHIIDNDTSDNEVKELINFYVKNDFPDLNEVFFIRYYPNSVLTKDALRKGYISKEEESNINEGLIKGGIIKTKNKKVLKYFQSIIISPIIPRKILDFIVNKKYLLKIPFLGNIFLRILLRIIRPVPFDFNTEQFINRYAFFIKKFFLNNR